MKHIFVINSHAGKKNFATELRRQLSQIPDFDYYVFNTRKAGEEAELVRQIRQIFDDEKLRFYCCGGSGTFRNMLNGFERFDDMEIAFYPCGITNDFMKIFGKDMPAFTDIRSLIEGEAVKIDYLKSNNGVMLNTLSFGVDSKTVDIINRVNYLQIVNENLPYNVGVIFSMLGSDTGEYIIEHDNGVYRGKCTEVVFGNGIVYGGNLHFVEQVNVKDGIGCLRVLFPKRGFGRLKMMLNAIHSDFAKLDAISEVSMTKKVCIRRADGAEIAVNQDGEIVRGVREWTVEIVPNALPFVIPKGVMLHE